MKKMLFGFFCVVMIVCIIYSNQNYFGYTMGRGSIDNTNHGWEVKRNHDHKQPEIHENAKDIITKYNGIYTGDSDKKVIYLTIDLGYETGNTRAILDILKKQEVKATFFIIQSYLEKNPDIVDRIVNEGHSLQNHTANYKHLNTLSEYLVKKEIMDMHNVIDKRYGIKMKYLRLPYEEWSENVMKIANDTGYKTVFWSIACVDWVEGTDSGYIYDSIMSNYHNGGVILTHTVSNGSPNALNMIIRDLKGKGFEFKILDM